MEKEDIYHRIIDICMLADNGYAVPTCVAMKSMLLTKNPTTKYRFHIVIPAHSEELQGQLHGMAGEQVEIAIISEDERKRFSDLHSSDKAAICAISTPELLKFSLPGLLPDLDRVLYLDGDLLVKIPLDDLYETPLEDAYAAAVEDCRVMCHEDGCAKQEAHTFNSGVMLLNLQKMREDGITDRLIQTKCDSENSALTEQDVFNQFFDHRMVQLPVRYNFLPGALYRGNDKWTISQLNEKYGTDYPNKKALYKDAAIIHYASKDKPWMDLNCACADDWLEIYLKTPVEHSLFRLPQLEEKYAISVVIPCYNVGPYIAETLESLLRQTFRNFEVICYNDGSTDNTMEVLREYEKRCDRIHIFAGENHGLSWARNFGMHKAQGKYIYFFDGDDMLTENALERLYTCAEINRLDCVLFEGTSFYETEELEAKFPYYKTLYSRKEAFPTVLTGEEMYLFIAKKGGRIVSACMQMNRKAFLLENHICFPEVRMHEDNLYSFNTMRLAGRIKCIPDALYLRRVRANSIITAAKNDIGLLSLSVTTVEMARALKDYETDSEMHRAVAAQAQSIWRSANETYRKLMAEEGVTVPAETRKNNAAPAEVKKENAAPVDTAKKNENEAAVKNDSGKKAESQEKKTDLLRRAGRWIPKRLAAAARFLKRHGF